MASPQIQHGFTKIANELLDALCRVQLSGHEWSVINAIIRKTYGYNKKEDWVTNTQIANLTGLHKVRVSEAKMRLLEKGIVTENRNKISLVKDYEKWEKLRKTVTPVTENRNKELRKTVPTKDNKDNVQNKLSEQSSAQLKDNEKDMGFNKFSDDYEEGVVDMDSGELTQPEDEQKNANRELNKKIRHNLSLVEEMRGLPFGKGRDMNYHVKIYRELLEKGWSHKELVDTLIEIINSDHWKKEKQKGQYPGMNTVQFQLRNKKPQ